VLDQVKPSFVIFVIRAL